MFAIKFIKSITSIRYGTGLVGASSGSESKLIKLKQRFQLDRTMKLSYADTVRM